MMILNRYGTPLKVWENHSTDSKLQQLYQSYAEGRHKLASLPVCPKCESTGMRDRGWADNKIMSCPRCGYHGRSEYIYSAYVRDKCYK